MKRFHFASLMLAAALVIPAAAQNSQDQPQPAQQPAAQDNTNKDTTQATSSGKQPLKYESHEGFWGHMNPFARKKYTQKQLEPIRGRVNELDELTAKNSRMIADVDTRSADGIRQAMGKANEADSHALDASNRATAANQTAQQAHVKIASVEQTVTKLDQYQAVTQAEIRFRPGQNALSKPAKEALDGMAVALKDQRGYVIEVQGFSAGNGAVAIENSRALAQTVVRYLVLNHNIPVYRIYTVGMGNVPVQEADGKAHHTRGGRVEISLLKNSLGDMTPAATSAAPAPATQK